MVIVKSGQGPDYSSEHKAAPNRTAADIKRGLILAVAKLDRAAPHNAESLLRPKMPELDCVRGFAILMVLFFHGFASRYGYEGLRGPAKLFVRLVSPGWTGVNLFFALSGFLITGILLDGKHHPQYYRRFYLRRALRILPAYYTLLLLLVLCGRYGLHGENFSWAFLGLSAIYLSNISVLLGVPTQFGVLWSLAVEEHFYLLWPVAVRNVNQSTAGVIAVTIAVSASLARVVTFWLGCDYFGHYTWLVADALALGSLLAVLVRGPLGTRAGVKLISMAAFLGSVILVLIDHCFNHPLVGGALDITALNLLCTSAVASALLLGTSSWSSLIHQRTLRLLGEISYGLYLIHMLVFNIFDNLQERFFPYLPSFKGRFDIMAVRFFTCIPIAIGLAVLSRRYLEEPFLRLKDRLHFARPADEVRKVTAAEKQTVQ